MSNAPLPPTIGLATPHLSGVYCGAIIVAAQREAQRQGVRLIVIQGSPYDIVQSRLACDVVQGWIAVLDTNGVALMAESGVPVVTISSLVPNISAVLP
ncbi:MAG TPA: hypothetical protein VFT99_17190, partial [Roseiflexaceae bacterium]|nr:hypothetical protein [Roseiflexaceae bacterium]